LPNTIVSIDCTTESLSGWTRFINHARGKSNGENLAIRIDCYTPRVWFVARREVAIGEELAFDYGDVWWE